MFRTFLLLYITASLSSTLHASKSRQNHHRTIVLVNDYDIRNTHATFFKLLRNRGHNLTFKSVEDTNISLFKYGRRIYDNLFLFAAAVEEIDSGIDKKMILNFIDEGGNALFAFDHTVGGLLREIAAECGVEVDGGTHEESLPTQLIDHFNHQHSDPTHTLLIVDANNLISVPAIAGSRKIPPLLYRGVGMLVNELKPQVLTILKAGSTTYSYKLHTNVTDEPILVGGKATLLAAVQTENDARIVFSGSLDFFSNKFFASEISAANGEHKHEKSSNADVSDRLCQWLFQETGVIRIKSMTHHKKGEREPPLDYTIMEKTVFEIQLEQKRDGKWIPFDTEDLYVEFVRIDPFIRIKIPRVEPGKYVVEFVLPDTYGVFKFVIDYRRPGYTFLYRQIIIPVKPLKHTQYERFIPTAYPYYAAAFAVMITTFLFSLVYLHGDYDDKQKRE